MYFSIVIPLYNRPQEIQELLESLVQQTYRGFEVIVVEDGSHIKAEDIVASFADRLSVRYFYKSNEGQGIARNFGFAQAEGDYFIILDSDVIVPPDYLDQVRSGLQRDDWDAFGGPDAAHESFTTTQRAISYAMTSPFTTGGIRGNKKHVGVFHPRSFNMGLSRRVWEQTGGFAVARRSEDIEFSIRMIDQGFRVGLISEAFVYHKRRTKMEQFHKQVYEFGKGRVDIYRRYPGELKFVHTLPAFFVLGLAATVMLNAFNILTNANIFVLSMLAHVANSVLLIYTFLVFVHAWMKTKHLLVAARSVVATYTQLLGYGYGFLEEYTQEVLCTKGKQR